MVYTFPVIGTRYQCQLGLSMNKCDVLLIRFQPDVTDGQGGLYMARTHPHYTGPSPCGILGTMGRSTAISTPRFF